MNETLHSDAWCYASLVPINNEPKETEQQAQKGLKSELKCKILISFHTIMTISHW